MSLANERCEACTPGTPHLSDAEVSDLKGQISPKWEVVSGHERLRRRIKTKDFKQSLNLANKIGEIAEAEGHHPDLQVRYGRLVVALTTHAADGLTRNDFILASKLDPILADA